MSSFRSDHLLVRDYITANDHLQYQNLAEGVVCIHLTQSNLTATHPDIRLDLHSTILQVKEKFLRHVGTHVAHQRLMLKRDGQTICEMSDDNRMLGFYGVESGMEIHVVDTDPYSLSRGGGLTDTSLIQKYTMSEESYANRKGTMREYFQKQRQLNPNFKVKPLSSGPRHQAAEQEPKEPVEIPGVESIQGITVDARCEVSPGGRRGIVRFVGEIEQMSKGYWVGVQFDEPVGKNDGSVKGRRIFECLPGFGGFVRGKNVQCGDYPERSLLDELDDDDNDNDNQPAAARDEEDEDEI